MIVVAVCNFSLRVYHSTLATGDNNCLTDGECRILICDMWRRIKRITFFAVLMHIITSIHRHQTMPRWWSWASRDWQTAIKAPWQAIGQTVVSVWRGRPCVPGTKCLMSQRAVWEGAVLTDGWQMPPSVALTTNSCYKLSWQATQACEREPECYTDNLTTGWLHRMEALAVGGRHTTVHSPCWRQ